MNRYLDLNILDDTNIKHFVRSSCGLSSAEKKNFHYATQINKKAYIMFESEKCYRVRICYKVHNGSEELQNKSILCYFPKGKIRFNSTGIDQELKVIEEE